APSGGLRRGPTGRHRLGLTSRRPAALRAWKHREDRHFGPEMMHQGAKCDQQTRGAVAADWQPAADGRAGRRSNGLQWPVGLVWKLDSDPVAGTYIAAHQHDAHDACLADELPIVGAAEHGIEQARLDAVELGTRVAQAGDLDDGRIAQAQSGARWQTEKVDAASRYVLTHLTCGHREPRGGELVVQLA